MENNAPITEEKKENLTVPFAIIIAGVIIAASVLYAFGGEKESLQAALNTNSPSPERVTPVSEKDHIRGDKNATIKIVEFSDTECPYCKQFHMTMLDAIEEYGVDGRVAWVYRHFPLDANHSKARKESEATECAAELGGNDAFWRYLDRLMEITPSNDGLDLAELPRIAEYVGLDVNAFSLCLSEGRYAERVANDLEDGINSGAKGTPYSVVIAANGKKFIIPGALPYDMLPQLKLPMGGVKQIIETALRER